MMLWNTSTMRTVTLTDKNKFSSNDPHGLKYYWYGLRSKTKMYSKRVHREQSVMLWGTIKFDGTFDSVGIEGNMDSRFSWDVL